MPANPRALQRTALGRQQNTVLYRPGSTQMATKENRKSATLHVRVPPAQASEVSLRRSPHPWTPQIPTADIHGPPFIALSTFLLCRGTSSSTVVEGKQNKHFYHPLRSEEIRPKHVSHVVKSGLRDHLQLQVHTLSLKRRSRAHPDLRKPGVQAPGHCPSHCTPFLSTF